MKRYIRSYTELYPISNNDIEELTYDDLYLFCGHERDARASWGYSFINLKCKLN